MSNYTHLLNTPIGRCASAALQLWHRMFWRNGEMLKEYPGLSVNLVTAYLRQT